MMRPLTTCLRVARLCALLSLAASTTLAAPQAQGGQEEGDGGFAGPSEVTSSATASATSSMNSGPGPEETSSASTPCNNSPALCDRPYGNVTHMGAHNSAFLRDESTDNSVSGNQFFSATRGLDAGLRLLQAQVREEEGALHLCHSSCRLLDAGALEDWLTGIREWLDENPNDVVTVLLVNSDDMPVEDFGAAFESAGLDRYGYERSNGENGDNSWPTLQEMIDDGDRLVAFISSIEPSPEHPYLLNQFDHVFETPFEVTSPEDFHCVLDRPSDAGTALSAIDSGKLPLMNHFLYDEQGADILVPAVDQIDETNSPDTGGGPRSESESDSGSDSGSGSGSGSGSVSGSFSSEDDATLGAHAAQCRSDWGRVPTFVLVDFWDRGPAIATADQMNGIEEPVGRDEDATERDDSSAGVVAARQPRSASVLALLATGATMAATILS